MPEETREEAIKRLTESASSLEARTQRQTAMDAAGQKAAGQAWRIVAEMIGGVLVGMGLGWGFDMMVGTLPWGTIAGTLVGFGVSIWLALHTARRLSAQALAEFGPPRDLPDDAEEDEDR